jgi:anti-sigma B factor antagonist
MPDVSYPVQMISGLPVIAAPPELDVTTADQLRAVLLETAAHGHTTVVVDMTSTQFCDSCGLSILVRAHKRALEEGGELRLVIPAGGTVHGIFTLTSLYRFIPRFGSRPEALLQRPTAPSRPSGPLPAPWPGSPGRRFGSPARRSGSPDGELRAGG